MPTHKAKILNTSIDINYEKNDREKLIHLISNLKNRIKNFNHLNGKVSDIKIIILAAIAIEDELLEKNENFSISQSLETDLNKSNLKIEKLNTEIINLKDKLSLIESELERRNRNDNSKDQQIEEVANQIEILNKSILSIYNE